MESTKIEKSIIEKDDKQLGGKGKIPLAMRQDHLSIGAKMHISSIAITSLSIKTPLFILWRAKKKAEGQLLPRPMPLHRMNKAVIAKKLYHKSKIISVSEEKSDSLNIDEGKNVRKSMGTG